jgi:hypothetical protein
MSSVGTIITAIASATFMTHISWSASCPLSARRAPVNVNGSSL